MSKNCIFQEFFLKISPVFFRTVSGRSWFHLANALAGLQQYPQAVEAFKKTTALKVDEGLGRVGLAFAYFGDKKPDLAIEELKKAMKTFKSNKNISWHRDCRLGVCRT